MSHESDSASRHRNMLKSSRLDIPHVGALLPAIGFVRHPPTGQYALVYPDRDLASDARGPTLRTQRLVLRRWRAEDLAPFAELNADPDVMAHMQKTMSREESDAFVARIEEECDDCGFGLWAVEAPNHSPFIGFVG